MFWRKKRHDADELEDLNESTFSLSEHPQKTAEINPYAEARKEWATRHGNLVRQASTWRIGFLCSLAYGLIATIMLAIVAQTTDVIPHIVEVDREGQILTSYSGQSLLALATENIIRSFIVRWVEEFRGVTVDRERQNQRLQYVAAHMLQADTAFRVAADYLAANDPFARASTATVITRIEDMRRLGGSAWYVTWEERTIPRSGGAIRTEVFSAAMTVQQLDVSAATAMRNPLGLYVRELDLSPEAF